MVDFASNFGAAASTAASSAAAAVQSERWAKPATAHANDEEFETTSLSNFTLYDSTGAAVAGQPQNTTIDPYVDDGTNHHANAHAYRRSWVTIKCRDNNARFYYVKPVTLVGSETIWARVGQKTRSQDNEADIGLVLLASSAGSPDPANRIELIAQDSAGGRKIVARMTAAGVDTTVFNGAAQSNELQMSHYLQVTKLTNAWHFWIGGEGGGRVYLGTGNQTVTIAFVGFILQNNTGVPGNGTVESDFIRFVESSTFQM